MHEDPIVIVSAVRTPMGGFQGDLRSLTAPQLGAAAIAAAVERAAVDAHAVDQVLFADTGDEHPRRISSGSGGIWA